MKSSEFHKILRKSGWNHIRTSGSHYIYEKEGRTYPVPYHGSKEIGGRSSQENHEGSGA
ncbi:type II toxin-antitoxin system HicA family toxin [Sphingobacterium faecium]|uniref:type II toxin-antitoxin system HicA family toxin n=1 Tax=Sphingobacterium faecium TaxID=34087 RepID=UPI001D16FE33|nr:type II toxin-antitoxin system HicA family toxin [Sphingobacterium faecium]